MEEEIKMTVLGDALVDMVALSDEEIGMVITTDAYPEGINHEPFLGPYEVIPEVYESQTLETKNKYMRDDLVVKEVPLYKTPNKGGTTIYIGRRM